jgi:predicted nucleic acid-binding Zn ribbon protein
VANLVSPVIPFGARRIKTRRCSECGTFFDSTNAKQQTCSDKCRQQRARRIKERA